jgi:hypothetical protein
LTPGSTSGRALDEIEVAHAELVVLELLAEHRAQALPQRPAGPAEGGHVVRADQRADRMTTVELGLDVRQDFHAVDDESVTSPSITAPCMTTPIRRALLRSHSRNSAPARSSSAVDVEAAELFPIAGSPLGDVRQHIPGRDGSAMSVRGYRHGVGNGVWRFETTTDAGRSWQRTDVSLPLRRTYLWRYADVTTHAVGPGHLQAIAMSDAPPDLPLYLWELWRTDDEQQFHRVRLPWERMRFGGMAFASDGALLLAEVGGSDRYCDALVCNRPGRIWRLAQDETKPRLLPEAPRLFGPFWAVGIHFSGGSIVARTGLRTIGHSVDGYTWTEVTPGQRDVSLPAVRRR